MGRTPVNAIKGHQGFQETGVNRRGKDTVPTAADTPATPGEPMPADDGTDQILGTFTRYRTTAVVAPAVPASTGKQGTDIPPLVVSNGSTRLYIADPADRAAVEADPDKALADGKAFPSITTCLGTLDKPALVPWAVGMSADLAEERFRELADTPADEREAKLADWLSPGQTASGRPNGRTKIRTMIAGAHKQKKDEAATRGTGVHALVEQIARGENPDIPEGARGYVEAYRAFRAEYPDIEYLYTEATVINRDAGSMGTTDAIVRIGDRVATLDYKTNKDGSVYSSTGMQLAAAANAEAIVHADGRQEPMPKIDGGIGIGLAPNGKYKVYFFETERNGPNYQGFKAAAQAWRALHAQPKPDTVSRDFFG